jgi:hypothetical protein
VITNNDKGFLNMNIHLKGFLVLIIASFSLLGCQAEDIETTIKSKDLRKLIAGEKVAVKFEATLSLLADSKDDETKAQIKSIGKIVEKYIDTEEFEVTTSDFGLKIEIEGNIPLVYSPNAKEVKSVKSPWAMMVSDNRDGGSLSGYSYKLTFSATSQFEAFSGELSNINMMLSPNKRQPLKIKLRNSGKDKLRIFTGGVEVGGESRVLYEANVDKRVSLTMKGGVYDNVAQVVYFSFK